MRSVPGAVATGSRRRQIDRAVSFARSLPLPVLNQLRAPQIMALRPQVIVPGAPDIVTYGRTIEEAREMAQDAISCHLQGLLKEGLSIQ